MSFSVTQSFIFPSAQCHSLSHSPLPSHLHSVTPCDHTILQLPIHTVSLSAITQSCIFKKSIHIVSLSVVTQSSSHSHCFTLSSHSPSSSHSHRLTLCHHIYIFQFTQCHTLSSQSFIFPFTKCHSLSSHSQSFFHLHRVTVIKQVSSLPLSLCISFLKLFPVCSHSQYDFVRYLTTILIPKVQSASVMIIILNHH